MLSGIPRLALAAASFTEPVPGSSGTRRTSGSAARGKGRPAAPVTFPGPPSWTPAGS